MEVMETPIQCVTEYNMRPSVRVVAEVVYEFRAFKDLCPRFAYLTSSEIFAKRSRY